MANGWRISLGLSLAVIGFVTTPSASARPRVEEPSVRVLFFGGFGSSPQQMSCWLKGAQAQVPEGDIGFEAFPYPIGSGAGAASAVHGAASELTQALAEMERHPTTRYVIVGHSSGAAIANELARRAQNPEQVELIDLDGFAPSTSLRERVRTSCWYGDNPLTHQLSLNGGSMKSVCPNAHPYQDTSCRTGWCLHFSLVNRAAPAGLSGRDFKSRGYEGCDTNLEWLKGSSTLRERGSERRPRHESSAR